MMRPSKYLRNLHIGISRRLSQWRTLVHTETTRFSWPESDRVLSYVTLRCLNTWANFCRAYFLSCVLLPWRENGSQITVGDLTIRTFDDAISATMRRLRPWMRTWSRRNEPPWHVPNTLIKSCEEIRCSNYQDILRAFSTQFRVFEHLPEFRNFYAHRNQGTVMRVKEIAARQYSMQVNGHPTEILLRRPHNRPQSLLLDWIDEIDITVELLCH